MRIDIDIISFQNLVSNLNLGAIIAFDKDFIWMIPPHRFQVSIQKS
jgi:hypothetical protein